MRINLDKPIDGALLAAQLTDALGVPVALSFRLLMVVGGQTIPGVLMFLDPTTGTELDGLDLDIINAVVAAHVVPPSTRPPHGPRQLLENASDFDELKAALLEIHESPPSVRLGSRKRGQR